MKTHIGSYVMTYVSKLFLWFVRGFSDIGTLSKLSLGYLIFNALSYSSL
ncbi:hypothetical protein F383_30569 [Gossypium arboreum]|uniref:Uncharacterized protein n=1 Tax=Gossypium arboreum TaxID=29729 RepID=A0A0B0MUE9_GOSAR|nr:hypothetical protein F383_30569 [Gossypium arboreum]